MDAIFDNFIVVDEKIFNDLNMEVVNHNYPMHNQKQVIGNSNCAFEVPQAKTNSKFSEVTPFAALEFKNFINILQISDIGNISKSDVPLAQIVRWEWNIGKQMIKETKLLNTGCNLEFSSISSSSLFIIRILQKREKNNENPCPPISSPDDDLTVQIGDKKITVSAAWLMSVSPVVRRMLSVEMKEKQQRLITLDELGIDMEQFMKFVEAISLNALQTPILPNPKNVLVLLKLADFFQVDSLKWRCEMHLINCVEIPLIDRFILSDKYGLNNLKNFFLRLHVENLRAFFKANREHLLSVMSNEFLANFIFPLAG